MGWRGLGIVDGFDMGETLNPKQEFALNIFCLVIEPDIALRCILNTLPGKMDCSRLKIAARLNNEIDGFALKYAAKEAEKQFYI